ncbi:MAG: metallophosphoesterase [Clostridia bacterium]|nr:metallophosphoesterase [Clostridia bacterium]
MSIFAIGDLHLSLGADKPMDVFGGWDNYVERLEKNWKSIVAPEDTVVLCGDLSWSMKLENTAEDFGFINSLPGRKLIIKGNHDYWWTTRRKMENFFAASGFDTLGFIHNSACAVGDICLCGTRGWAYDAGLDEEKYLNREAGRLSASLDEAAKTGLEPVVFLHYPPIFGDYVCEAIVEVLHRYNVKRCYYGHLHGYSHSRAAVGEIDGIKYSLVACDYTDFTPVLVQKQKINN